MKALVLEVDNGLEWENNDHYPKAVFLVPDDYTSKAEWSEFVRRQKKSRILKFDQHDSVCFKDLGKFPAIWEAWLGSRFLRVEVVS